jgi:hypothetical protein
MVDSLTISIPILITFILLVGVVFRRIRQKESGELFIELEKLVKCRFCSSLILEGGRKCAFCGAWQRQDDSGEQINARERNGTNAAEIDTSRRMRIAQTTAQWWSSGPFLGRGLKLLSGQAQLPVGRRFEPCRRRQ